MNEYLFPSEPHFDDERTLISAQPVVPLDKINKKARHRRQWFLGSAFAIAMMLGAASALLASYLKLRHTPAPVTEVSEDADVAPAPLPVAESVAATTPEPENIETVEPAIMPKPSMKHRKVVVKPVPESVEPSDTQMSEQEQL